LVLAALLAAGSAAGGLGLSLRLDWPAGASIVLVSSAVFTVAAVGRVLVARRT
jgi:ABC-type Mn2+/Zn2+ transport system permease subunit